MKLTTLLFALALSVPAMFAVEKPVTFNEKPLCQYIGGKQICPNPIVSGKGAVDNSIATDPKLTANVGSEGSPMPWCSPQWCQAQCHTDCNHCRACIDGLKTDSHKISDGDISMCRPETDKLEK